MINFEKHSKIHFSFSFFGFLSFFSSNYAPTIAIQKEAEKQGCQQVLWLHGEDHLVTEVGTMNVMVFWTNENGGKFICQVSFDVPALYFICFRYLVCLICPVAEKELVTAPLDGLILPGVTRRSLLDLSRQWVITSTTRIKEDIHSIRFENWKNEKRKKKLQMKNDFFLLRTMNVFHELKMARTMMLVLFWQFLFLIDENFQFLPLELKFSCNVWCNDLVRISTGE